MQITRRQDWPEQLAAQVAAAQRLPYQLGVHDCLRFSCQCICAMTGVDLWPSFAGYRTRREAVAVLACHGATLEAAAANIVGVQPGPVLAARRGDLVTFKDRYGEHLGVCTGSHVAVLGHAGLQLVRLDHAGLQASVRIG
ncbi:DUF6950 family protein [Rhodoferax aquaticus]|uniref:DUF6950 domain-containing protein n=1 Tax=Rhodoferax aquaticus TaxID=2527691 RepID=A0A515ERJ4_9BURK|nr:hypothetical protein EXZ61_14600 [Rhodoferax aquaticus]